MLINNANTQFYDMYKDLRNKVAVVTGASSGIGSAIAERLAKEKMQVIVNYYHEEEAAEQLVKKIESKKGKAIAAYADIKNEKDIKGLLETALNTFGDLDLWVNNAGLEKAFPSHEMPLAEWQFVIDTNLTGTFLGSKEALNYFLDKKKRGNIINISSVHEIIPRPYYVNYAVSKAGVRLLTQSLAIEYASTGIRINAIGPGGIDTPINSKDNDKPEESKSKRKIPMGYMGSPHDIANAVAWLASSESAYVTGTTIFVDGGLLLYP